MSEKEKHENKPDEPGVNVEISNNNSDDDEIEIINESNESTISKLQEELETTKQKLSQYEEKLKYSLADFQNLQRKTQSDIENGINSKIDKLFLNFLTIYDDLIVAKKVLEEEKTDVSGIESIIKNMNSLLKEYSIAPINALGEIFNPNLHEAISVVEDSSLEEGTITKEIRKGYISGKRVIRPTIVEISKKIKSDNSNGETNG